MLLERIIDGAFATDNKLDFWYTNYELLDVCVYVCELSLLEFLPNICHQRPPKSLGTELYDFVTIIFIFVIFYHENTIY